MGLKQRTQTSTLKLFLNEWRQVSRYRCEKVVVSVGKPVYYQLKNAFALIFNLNDHLATLAFKPKEGRKARTQIKTTWLQQDQIKAALTKLTTTFYQKQTQFAMKQFRSHTNAIKQEDTQVEHLMTQLNPHSTVILSRAFGLEPSKKLLKIATFKAMRALIPILKKKRALDQIYSEYQDVREMR